MTIETKIAKNGSKRYYVRDDNGKLSQISRQKAYEIQTEDDNKIMANLFEQTAEKEMTDIEQANYIARVDIETSNKPTVYIKYAINLDTAAKFIHLCDNTFGERIINAEIRDTKNNTVNVEVTTATDANEEIKFCYKTNRGNVRELKIGETNWSDKEVNPLENKYFRMYHPDACANEEIINCTDDIIITDDAYTQMIRTELANAQIASGNYGIQINGEWVYFSNLKITHIDAERKLGFSFEYTLQGRKQFRHNGRVISRDGVIKFFENKDTAKAQEKSFREFFINPDAPKHGFFQVQISPTFADSCEHNYTRYFEYYSDAINFANDAIKFCGDVPTYITIKRDKQAGKVYYHRMPDGSIHVDKPDTDFFKNYSADEIKSRIGEIDRAIADNTQFRNENDSPIIGVAILNANDQLAVTRNFYEFVLHENAPATIAETDGSEEDDFVDEMPALYPAEDSDDDDELIDTPEIESTDNIFIGQDGTNYIIRAKNIIIAVEDRKIKINGHVVAKYKTDAGVQNALKYVTDWRNNIANYKIFDINDWNTVFDDFDFAGGNEDKFVYIDDEPPITDKVITPDEMLALVDTLDTVNAAAPYGWQIDFDGKNFPVKFNNKIVTTLDSLTLTKVLPPDKFFDWFNPDVSPKEQYINERRKELDMLLDFRKFVEDDPDRLKTLANLIEDVKREILDAELDTEHPPDIEFDEHGDVIP